MWASSCDAENAVSSHVDKHGRATGLGGQARNQAESQAVFEGVHSNLHQRRPNLSRLVPKGLQLHGIIRLCVHSGYPHLLYTGSH